MGKHNILLTIIDGFGISKHVEGNAIQAASTPTLDAAFSHYPTTTLKAAEEAVGLPKGQMGNSEVGHLNLGAGRIVYQDLTRINKAIKDGSFYQNKIIISALNNAKQHGTSLHIIGLVSDGGVHSHNTHLYALLDLAQEYGLTEVYIHAFLDGRDVGPETAYKYLEELEEYTHRSVGKIATISGRYYAMDRDNRWERIKKAYDAMARGIGRYAKNSSEAIRHAYDTGETDEFVTPTIITTNSKPVAIVSDNDSILFFNFRADRARQITVAFIKKDFTYFEREYKPVFFVGMTEYDESFRIPTAFPKQDIENTLAKVVSEHNLTQLRIAETEKYAHVTFFFNGGKEMPVQGEDRILVPSPKVSTYDKKPEMSAYEITEKVVEAIKSQRYDVIILNYANCDMVGHTGDFQAAVKAVETVDLCIARLMDAINMTSSTMIITADHGNAEQMIESSGKPHTAHTCNPVPLTLVSGKKYRLHTGILADVAPTILDLLNIEKPDEMTGKSLLVR
ncbi:MAG: 2,3-bisphosphoglycerate-independent phosphoglycerate mutase [Candidatus Argoarchaeum ethanivorans]|uniref:2,3-bisphosphoglycerate-independent phosphoglycerate mutase n=2 Tax=Candidatus Argoarchaeum ethanivorans TaxID=2608793 RepID=A0A811T799_9EURY|nr:MAG: 2,3-bisphosphoglycerate-independent phosphoglycerate mutase [Candidatus Argoarchaeum ethanivorans]